MVYKYRRILLIKNMVDGMNITTFILGCDSLDETLNQANPFHTIRPFLCTLEISGDKSFSNIFRGYKKVPVA